MATPKNTRGEEPCWYRGKGYYNAASHDVPTTWVQFRDYTEPMEMGIRRARYIAYLLSWVMTHKGQVPTVDQLDATSGEKILDRLEEAMKELHTWTESNKGAKPKKRGKK